MSDRPILDNETIPIRYPARETDHFKRILEKARKDVEEITGDPDSMPLNMLNDSVRSRMENVLWMCGFEPEFHDDVVIVNKSKDEQDDVSLPGDPPPEKPIWLGVSEETGEIVEAEMVSREDELIEAIEEGETDVLTEEDDEDGDDESERYWPTNEERREAAKIMRRRKKKR